MQVYIDKIYSYIKQIIMDKMECDENSEILIRYKKYLTNCYSTVLTNEKAYNFFLSKEIDYWKNMSKENIEMKLNPDLNYFTMEKLSHEAMDHCIKKLNEGVQIDKETFEELKGKMMECFSKVRKYNKLRAQVLLSEGLIDLSNAAGLSDDTSVRLSLMMGNNNEKNNNK